MQREQQSPGLPAWAQGDDASTSLAPDVSFNFQGGPHDVSDALYMRAIVAGGFRFSDVSNWPTAGDHEPILELAGLAYHATFGRAGSVEANIVREQLVARVRVANGRCDLWASAGSREALEALEAELRTLYPPFDPDPEAPEVPVTFWASSSQGPVQRTRQISVPPWVTIEGHYLDAVRRPLNAIMGDEFRPGAGGQLFMWDGEPGTGKTYALRALAWEWREWCDLHYVTDPEVFFGEKSNYMLEVLLASNDNDPQPPIGDGEAPARGLDPRADGGRWKLLVLEDTGELMSKDARERSGQGLSRLLNVVDGLIGQGLRVLVLVTTNEDIRRLHDAVSRPGRCASRIKFAAFPPLEACEWLAERDLASDDVNTAMTLAELYARLEHREMEEAASSAVGFAT